MADNPSPAALSGPSQHTIELRINRVNHRLNVESWVSLLDLLRDRLQLTGTKKGCDHGQCGACTVLVDGRHINACLTLAVMQDGREITTVEGLASLVTGPACIRCSRPSPTTTRSSAVTSRRASCVRRWNCSAKARRARLATFAN